MALSEIERETEKFVMEMARVEKTPRSAVRWWMYGSSAEARDGFLSDALDSPALARLPRKPLQQNPSRAGLEAETAREHD